VVLCRSAAQAGAALAAVREILTGLGLGLHPDKTRVVISPENFGPVELLRPMPLAGVASTR
jgi:hypothetical protein